MAIRAPLELKMDVKGTWVRSDLQVSFSGKLNCISFQSSQSVHISEGQLASLFEVEDESGQDLVDGRHHQDPLPAEQSHLGVLPILARQHLAELELITEVFAQL